MKKKLNNALQSKALGKVLDSKYAKKVGIPIGNKVIKASRSPFVWMGKQLEKEGKARKRQDDIYRWEAQKRNRNAK